MLDFATAFASVGEALLEMFPDSLEYNGITYPCIAPPKEQMKTITETAYEAKATAGFQMRETDRADSGITTRSFFKSNGLDWQVYAITGDPNDSLVNLRCNLKA